MTAGNSLAPALDLDAHPDAVLGPAGHGSATDALLEAVYQTALNPENRLRLQDQLLVHFREDRSHDETPLTRVVLNHIKRALRLGATHSALQRERQQVLDVIDAVAPPVIVIDPALRVLGLNRDAEALMGTGDAFGVRDGTLFCREPDTLAQLMAQADHQSYGSARIGPAEAASAPGLLVYIYKNTPAPGSAGPASYSLLLIDRHRGIQRSIAYLGQRVGLTPREAEVIDLSIQGLDLDAICTRTGITLHTLRQHIKNIYTKTGVHNQNGLFALVLRNIVLEQAGSSQNARLLPHITGLANSRTLRLPDGRQLGYAEYGAPQGVPVLYFHALNASRLELLMHADRLREFNIRLIALDRPGYGHSSFVERRDYRDFTADVRALLDELRIDRAHTLGASAGCAHALHCGWAMPDRIRSVHCTAVVPPTEYILASNSPSALNSVMNQFFRVVPSLLRPAMELALMGQSVESLLTSLGRARESNAFSLTPSDIAFINAPDNLPYFVASMMESLRQGTRAWAMESVLINQPWSIALHDIRPPIHLWYGTEDGLVPTDMVAAFAQALPNARLTVVEKQTHLFALRNIEQVLHALLADEAAAGA